MSEKDCAKSQDSGAVNDGAALPCPSCEEPSGRRRHFLRTVGALGAASLLPGCAMAPSGGSSGAGSPAAGSSAAGSSSAAGGGSAGVAAIDTHHHFYAPEYQSAWLAWEEQRKIPHFPTQVAWSRSKSLEEMDRNNVASAVLSLASTPGVWFDQGTAEAVRMARLCNEYGADMVRSYPGRFGLFATLPMIDVDASLKELEYALDVLKADGVGLQTNYGDKWPGNPAFRPVFEELNRRKAVVYFHPLVASCCGNLSVGTFPAVIEVPHDTTRAVVSLLLSGTLARNRDIRWLFSHAGGTVPMLAGRIEFFTDARKDREQFAPQGVEAELRRLHYDTANATHPASMAALLKLVPVSQVVFGTDYPYVPTSPQREALEKSGLSAADVRAIERDNAAELVPRLKAPRG